MASVSAHPTRQPPVVASGVPLDSISKQTSFHFWQKQEAAAAAVRL